MEEVGVDGATVAAIVERAHASVGSFYARFRGKEDLVRHLQDQVWNEARERWDEALAQEAWDNLSIGQVVEGVVGILLRSIQADFHRRKVLGRASTSDSGAVQHVLSFHDHLVATVTPLFLSRRGEITHPDPEGAIRFGYHVMVGAIREFIELEQARGGFPKEGVQQLELVPLGPELAHLWTGYLRAGSGSGAAPEEGDVDFFDPWS